MKVINTTNELIQVMEPIVNKVGFSIQKFETTNVDELKRYVIATMWDTMLSRLEKNSPIRIVLNRERLNEYVAMICRAGKKSDFLQKLLEKTLGEEVVEAQGVITQPITLHTHRTPARPSNATAVTSKRKRGRKAVTIVNNRNTTQPVSFGPPSQLGTPARTNSKNSGPQSKRSKTTNSRKK